MKKYYKIIIFAIFIILSLILGFNHEPWADEAQAWLISRDASIWQILFSISKYEGSPSLWHLILKFLIFLKLPYEYYFLVPIFFTSIGVYIILFKLDINIVFKILIPFTYFIAFEYGIKARNYCLLLPILSSIAYLYNKRNEKVYLYNFFVLLLSFVSLHGAVISGVLWFLELIEILGNLGTKDAIKENKKQIISTTVIAIMYMFIIVSVFPNTDVYVNIAMLNLSDYSIVYKILFYVGKMMESFLISDSYYFLPYFGSLILLIILFYSILKSNKKKFVFLSIFFGEIVFIFAIRITQHHLGIIFLTFLFALYLVKDEINDKYNKVIFSILTLIFCIQIVWYGETYIADMKVDFSGSKEVAEYIKTLDYKNKKIYGTGYYLTSILPYFDENIFVGPRGGKSYYIWGKSNDDWYWSSNTEYLYPDILEDNPDIVILQDFYGDKIEKESEDEEIYVYPMLIETMKENENYNQKYFPGTVIFKGINSLNEKEGFYVFERIK